MRFARSIDWRGDLVAARSNKEERIVVTDLAARKTLAMIPKAEAVHVQVAPHTRRVMILEALKPSGRLSIYSLSGDYQWSFDLRVETTANFALDRAERRIAVAAKDTLLILDAQQGDILFRCKHPDSIHDIEFDLTAPHVARRRAIARSVSGMSIQAN